MLFEEWQEGTGLDDYEEYQLAERFYTAMSDSFEKKDLYILRCNMKKEHFKELCDKVLVGNDIIEEMNLRLNKLEQYKSAMDEINATLKKECNIDTYEVYIRFKAEKAKQEEEDRLRNSLKQLCENH